MTKTFLWICFASCIVWANSDLEADRIFYVCRPCGCSLDGERFENPGVCTECNMGLRPSYSGIEREAVHYGQEKIAILLFHGADIMDVTGPWSVFEHGGFQVVTVADKLEPMRLGMTLEVTPDFTLETLPQVDVLVIPGGGPAEMDQDPKLVAWIKKRSEQTGTLFSVCSGAFFLGMAGLLDGQQATTFAGLIPMLRDQFPAAKVRNDVKYTDSGRVITSAGLSSGMDAAFHVISKLNGKGRAQDIANHMEYEWDANDNYVRSQLADLLLSDLRGLATLFATEYLTSSGDKQHWTLTYRLTDKFKPAQIIKLVNQELEKNKGYKRTELQAQRFTYQIEAANDNWAKIEMQIDADKDGVVATLTATRMTVQSPKSKRAAP